MPAAVTAWQCGLLSPDETERLAVVRCTVADDLDHPRLGPGSDVGAPPCVTCGQGAAECPGHWGCVVLAEPVFHVLFLPALARTFGRVCRACGRPNAVAPCPACGHPHAPPRYSVDGDRLWRRADGGGGGNARTAVSARDALDLARRIPRDALADLGWHPRHAHPAWAIVSTLPVLPPAARPPAEGRPHPLTYKYRLVVRLNGVLRDALATAPPHIRRDFIQQLQWTVTTLFDAYETRGGAARQAVDRALAAAAGGPAALAHAGIKQRLTGKYGRMRSHLMGKRVDFCARTVISPDPALDLDEVGVPAEVARHLTVPVRVTAWNRAALCARVRRGDARFYVDGDGHRYDLSVFRLERLRVGDVLERPLATGDRVLMNRQPTLHRGSMMAHRVRVLPGKTFRLNLSVTTPYNADFDGDEMNLHVPQTLNAQAEAATLLPVEQHLLSQSHALSMGIVQDALLAAHLLTRARSAAAWFGRRDAQDLLFAADPDRIPTDLPVPAVQVPGGDDDGASRREYWSGHQLVSVLLCRAHAPLRRVYVGENGDPLGDAAPLVVRAGELLCGTFNKRTLGRGPNRLLHRLARMAPDAPTGRNAAGAFMDRMARLGHAFLELRGFSTGIGDCVLPRAAAAHLDRVHADAMETAPSLDAVRDTVGRHVYAHLGARHGMKAMADSGSKGSLLNIAQIIGCVGQQHLAGPDGRAPVRALPHFHRADTGAAARGYVAQSYVKGLDPHGFWFHAQAGRDGIIDTACKTATTGYLERKLVKALESVAVAYDGTVRHAAWEKGGAVVQFVYGDDGYDAAALVPSPDAGWPVPVDVAGLCGETERLDPPSGGEDAPPPPPLDHHHHRHDNNHCCYCTARFAHHVDDVLESRGALPWATAAGRAFFYGELERRCFRARVAPGEAVGAVAATCLAEPTTQMTLNSFHFTGISSKTGNLGVPRVTELLGASRCPRAPHVTWPSDDADAAETPEVRVTPRLRDAAATCAAAHRAFPPWWPRYAAVYGPLDPDAQWWTVRWRVRPPHRVAPAACRAAERAWGTAHGVRVAASPDGTEVLAAVALRDDDDEVNERVSVVAVLAAVRRGVERHVWTGARPWPSVVDVDRDRDGTVTVAYEGGAAALARLVRHGGPDAVPNDPVGTAALLGIEAARAVLVREIAAVFAFNGSYVAPRHVAVLADVMTWRGTVEAVSRHGFHRHDPVLKQMTFECTVPAVVAAAVRGARDEVRGVSEAVMLGQAVPVGTGLAAACLLDERALARYAVRPPAAPDGAAAAVWPPRNGKRRRGGEGGSDGESGDANPFAAPTDSGGGASNPFAPAAYGGEGDDATADDLMWLDGVESGESGEEESEEESGEEEACFSPLASPDAAAAPRGRVYRESAAAATASMAHLAGGGAALAADPAPPAETPFVFRLG